jgi:hypothetical protein
MLSTRISHLMQTLAATAILKSFITFSLFMSLLVIFCILFKDAYLIKLLYFHPTNPTFRLNINGEMLHFFIFNLVFLLSYNNLSQHTFKIHDNIIKMISSRANKKSSINEIHLFCHHVFISIIISIISSKP